MPDVLTLEGIIPAIATPFTEGGAAVDDDALRRLVQFEIESKVGGMIPCGSTGEFMHMTHEERKHVVEVVIDETAGRVPVIPHTAALTTKEAIELSKHAQDAGASAVMLIPPFYEPNIWPDLLGHYQAVSDAIEIPIMYYHMPHASGQHLTREQFEQLAEIENVRFIKDSSGDVLLFDELVQYSSDKVIPVNGEDKLTLHALAQGGRASVWGSATFFPGLAVELWDAVVTKQSLDLANDVWRRIWPIMTVIGETSYQAAVKAGCELVGVPVGDPRLPINRAPKEFYDKLADVLRESGVTFAG
ncbi:dihydrodipicolinate synthase family protein [Sphaerisporangium sp. NPDC051011]|uniref:dihydrodipicolinate synthase family protein n=1 Tax=Sphaerisporangium sp. NPDC051011 TaxID=3155792 RepID=UPI0033EFAEB2